MNPADIQNNTPTNPDSEQPQIPAVPQLQSETPLDITIYPNNENPEVNIEPQKISSQNFETSIAPKPTETNNNETFSTHPEPVQVSSPETTFPVSEESKSVVSDLNPTAPISNDSSLKDLTFDTGNPENNLSGNPTQIQNNASSESQKIAIIIGVVVGIFTVGIASWYFLSGSKKQISNTNVAQDNKPAPQVIPPSSLNPVQNLTLVEYQTKVDSLYNRYNNIVTSNPVDLTKATLSAESVRFISDEIFSITTEINELNIPDNLKPVNQSLYVEYKNLVNNYDTLLMTYKTSNTLNNEVKLNFNNSIKISNEKIKAFVDQIKNLK
jgi:hypothetical protein